MSKPQDSPNAPNPAPSHPSYGAPVEIPLAKIAPNPLNPRKVRTPAMVQALATSIRAVGLQNPIKVVRLTEAERQASPQCDYKVFCGEGRRLAYLERKMETIPAFILDLPPQEALQLAILDNRGEPMNWLETYEAMEAVQNADRNLPQRAIADLFGVSQKTVSLNLGVLEVLTPAARQLIYTQCINVTPGPPSEMVVRRIAALGDPEKVEKALKVALERGYKQPQATRLTAWVKAGNDPESFQPDGKGPSQGNTGSNSREAAWGYGPNPDLWEHVPKYIQVARNKEGEAVLTITVPASEAHAVAYYAAVGRMEVNDKVVEMNLTKKILQSLPSIFPGYSGDTNANRFARQWLETVLKRGVEAKLEDQRVLNLIVEKMGEERLKREASKTVTPSKPVEATAPSPETNGTTGKEVDWTKRPQEEAFGEAQRRAVENYGKAGPREIQAELGKMGFIPKSPDFQAAQNLLGQLVKGFLGKKWPGA